MSENKKYQNIKIIKLGTELLQDLLGYSRTTILKKLSYLGYRLSAASYAHILNSTRSVGLSTLHKTAIGIKNIVETELGYKYIDEGFKQVLEDKQLSFIPEREKKYDDTNIVFHKYGSVSINEEVRFIQTAKSEIIYFGTTLSNPINYFTLRNTSEYEIPIKNLLEKGVFIKFYLLNPESNEARLFYNDINRTSSFFDNTDNNTDTIKRNITKLKIIAKKFNSDLFKVYTYKHLPFINFIAVDGNANNGKLMISHQIYGVHFVNSPVLEINKIGEPSLYRKYWSALENLIKNATKVEVWQLNV